MEWTELFEDFYPPEDDDPDRLTIIDDLYTRIATGWTEVEEWENSSD